MTDDVLVFEEDFSALSVGVIGGDYSPAGEYHVVPALADSGRWRETVLHYSYKPISHGNWQVVLENDGHHVLEQTCAPQHWEPTLAAGEPYWREVTVEAGIRPLTIEGWRAIVFRYRHARRFYALTFQAGTAKVIRRDLDKDTVLGEAPCALDPDRYTAVKIVCHGEAIRVSADGKALIECSDTAPGAFAQGNVAFAATDLTRFRDLRVTSPREAVVAMQAERKREAEAVGALRARYPRPLLWKRIRTPEWGTDRNLRVGDINGDGRPELVLARSTNRLTGDYASITSLAAYDLDGALLWTIGEAGRDTRHTTCDLCFQVHDLDGDGKAEIYFCRDHELLVADGPCGKIQRRMTLPQAPPDKKWPRSIYRILGDSLYFCDLTGSGRPDCILVKDRYKNVWAYDRDFKLLWKHSGNHGHYPFARDIDGDGKDEVVIGYHLLDHDGKEKWNLPLVDHADNVAFADLQDGRGARRTRVVVAGSDAGFHLADLDGRLSVGHALGHAQGFCVGNLIPDREGLEIICNTFWGPAGITAVFDEAGKMLHEFEPMPYACLLQPVNWVPLDAGRQPADLVLLSAHIRQGGLIDGRGRRAVMFPDDGHPVLCSDARDLDGDGIDEVLTWDQHEIWIYKADRVPGRDASNYPRRNPWYNDSNYRAQLSMPKNSG